MMQGVIAGAYYNDYEQIKMSHKGRSVLTNVAGRRSESGRISHLKSLQEFNYFAYLSI